jgi:hypothetical protein
MGIDIKGGMILGAPVDQIEMFKDPDCEIEIGDWAYENSMDYMSPWYDCGCENWVIGFKISDISADEINEEWLKSIRNKADKFKKLTGAKAKLIGMQNVW